MILLLLNISFTATTTMTTTKARSKPFPSRCQGGEKLFHMTLIFLSIDSQLYARPTYHHILNINCLESQEVMPAA